MKFIIPLLVILATTDAFFLRNPFRSYDDDDTSSRSISRNYDNEELARRLGDILIRELRNNPDILHNKESDQTHNTEPDSEPVHAYDSEPAHTYNSDPVKTYHDEPIPTYHDEPVETFNTEPVETYIAEPTNRFRFASQYIARPVDTADEPVQHFFNIMFN